MAKFDLNTLEFGTLNNFGEGFGNKGDPRRDNSLQFLRQAMSDLYTPDSLKKVGRFIGVVVSKRQANRAAFQKKASILIALDTSNSKGTLVDAPYFVYKVYIPELESRPYPLDGADPVLQTYPDVYVTTDVEAKHGQLPIGGLVTVRYVDRVSLTDPMIIEYEGAIPLRWTGMKGNSSELAFKGGHGGALGYGGGSSRSTVGGQRGGPAPQPSGVGPRQMNKGPKYTYAELKPIYRLFKPILDAIAKPESGRRGYDAGNHPGTYRAFNMSEELFRDSDPADVKLSVVQSKMAADQLFASGRYQITPGTLKSAIRVADISATSYNYDNVTQDILGIELLLYRRGRAGLYLTGQSDDIVGAAQSIAMEWAGVPVQFDEIGGDKIQMVYRGESFYKYVGKNAAHEKPEVYISALQRTRQNLEGSSEAIALFGSATA